MSLLTQAKSYRKENRQTARPVTKEEIELVQALFDGEITRTQVFHVLKANKYGSGVENFVGRVVWKGINQGILKNVILK